MAPVKTLANVPALVLLMSLGCSNTREAVQASTNGQPALQPEEPDTVLQRLRRLTADELPPPPPDVTNKYADDPAAAALGKKFFFEKRFSGPLLDESNQGTNVGALGVVGEAGKVSCSGCHIPVDGSFSDTRSPRRQISLGAGWTRRRAPSLLNVGQATFLMWDGHRDTAFSQVFTPMEDGLEFNSSRLFIAQQVSRLYRDEYEAIFGPLPAALDNYERLAPSDAGCSELPPDTPHVVCEKPGADDMEITRVVVNVGKAIQAYTRKLSCGRSRFDDWMAGEENALSADEQAGARLFVGKAGCNRCHSGPYFTDQKFHNIGLAAMGGFFTAAIEDPGAAEGLQVVQESILNSKGPFSDGYDGRQDWLPEDTSEYLGAFRTPGLRCVSRRPSLMHTGQLRTLDDAVLFFMRGGESHGYLGTSENVPLDLSDDERAQLVAFLKALDGDGPDPALTEPPELPPDPVD